MAGQGTSISKKILKPLLLRELRKSPQLKEDIAHYDRAKPDTEDNSYDYLYRTLCRRIELNRQQQFRATLLAHQAKGDDLPPGTPGPRPKAKAKGKGVDALTVVTPRAVANGHPAKNLALQPVIVFLLEYRYLPSRQGVSI